MDRFRATVAELRCLCEQARDAYKDRDKASLIAIADKIYDIANKPNTGFRVFDELLKVQLVRYRDATTHNVDLFTSKMFRDDRTSCRYRWDNWYIYMTDLQSFHKSSISEIVDYLDYVANNTKTRFNPQIINRGYTEHYAAMTLADILSQN
jgi:hypothetical protein